MRIDEWLLSKYEFREFCRGLFEYVSLTGLGL